MLSCAEHENIFLTSGSELDWKDKFSCDGAHMSRVMRKPDFCINYAKTKTQISFAVTAKLTSAFVFATRIVQSLYFLNPKFQAHNHIQ